LIIDARGRPLALPTTVKALAPQIAEWYAQATGDEVFPIPSDWLIPIIEEPNIESVTDERSGRARSGRDRSGRDRNSRRARTVRALGGEGEASADGGKPRRGRLGRRDREAAEAVEPEGDESDLRSLLS
jgi:hypothetical protein